MKRIVAEHGVLRAVPEVAGGPYVLAVLCVPDGEAGLSSVPAAFAEALGQLLARRPGLDPAAQRSTEDAGAYIGASRSLACVREWMLANLSVSMSLDDLASRAFLSRRQFTRDFRAETGTSPGRWLLDKRLEKAARLLESTDLPIERIAAGTGFSTPAAFREQFKRRTGLTPSSYRACQPGGEAEDEDRSA